LIFVFLGLKDVYLAYRTLNYHETEGIVLKSEIVKKVSHSEKGTSITYEPRVFYQYRVGSRVYQNDGIRKKMKGLSSSYSWANGIVNKYPAGKKVYVYFNPSDPQDSVLEKGIYFEQFFKLIFGLSFLLFGTLFLMIFLASRKKKKDYREILVKPSVSSRYRIFFIFGLLFIVMTLPFMILYFSEFLKNKQFHILIILSIFPIVGLSFIIYSVIKMISLNRFRVRGLEISGEKGILGGYLKGSLYTKINPREIESIFVIIKCEEVIRARKSSSVNTIWYYEKEIERSNIERGFKETVISFEIPVPHDLPPSGLHEEKQNIVSLNVSVYKNIVWKIMFKCVMKGIDAGAEFEIPVVKTEESNPELTREKILDMDIMQENILLSDFKKEQGGYSIKPDLKKLRMESFLTLFAVIFSSGFLLLGLNLMKEDKSGGWIFTLVSLLFLIVTIPAYIYAITYNVKVIIKNNSFEILRESFLFYKKIKGYLYKDIADIDIFEDGKSGYLWFGLKIVLKNGETIKEGKISRRMDEIRKIAKLIQSKITNLS